MPGRIGPLLTTGVALSVAAVVVANPVVAPRADLEIPAVKLSGTGDALDMLNNDFLSRIAPAPAESPSNPFAVLKDLVTSLAADATYLTKNAIVSAFFAGASAVTNPELTAASFPFVPPVPPASAPGRGPVTMPAPVLLPQAVPGPMTNEQILAVAALPAELVPAAAHVVVTLMDSVRSLTDGTAVTAAFAVGALLVQEGGQVVDAVRGLVGQGVQVVADVLTAVTGGAPQNAIVNVFNDVIEQPAKGARSVPPASTESLPVIDQGGLGNGLLTPLAPKAENLGGERLPRRTAMPDTPEIAPPAAPDLSDLIDSGTPEDVTLKDLTPGITRPRLPAWSGPVNDALNQARHQAQGMLRSAVDAVRKAADHAGKAAVGPAGD